MPAYFAIFSASESCSRKRSSRGSKSISLTKLRFRRLNAIVVLPVGQNAASRSSGQVMQCEPPRPRPSSKPSIVMTSMPALRSAVFVPTLRS